MNNTQQIPRVNQHLASGYVSKGAWFTKQPGGGDLDPLVAYDTFIRLVPYY